MNIKKTIQCHGTENNMNWKQKIIDPKDKTNSINSSWFNLGNHILIAGFIGLIVFVIMASY